MRKTIIAVLLSFLLSLSVASAVSMGVQNSSLFTTYARSCTASSSLTATVSVNSSQTPILSGLPVACQGKTATVKIVAPAAASAPQGNATVASGTTTFTGLNVANPATVEKALVLVNGWHVNAVWVAPAANTTVTQNWLQMSPTQFCVSTTVTTTSTTPIPWTVTLPINQPPFNNDTTASHYQFTNGYGLVSTTVVNNTFTVRGTTTSTQNVSSSSSRTFTLCNYNTPNPAIATSATIVYSQTQTTPTASFYVCKTVTKSVTGTSFYVGWEAIVDVTDLKNLYQGTGGGVQGPYGDFTRTQVGTNTYRVIGTGWSTAGVRNGTSVSFSICWAG